MLVDTYLASLACSLKLGLHDIVQARSTDDPHRLTAAKRAPQYSNLPDCASVYTICSSAKDCVLFRFTLAKRATHTLKFHSRRDTACLLYFTFHIVAAIDGRNTETHVQEEQSPPITPGTFILLYIVISIHNNVYTTLRQWRNQPIVFSVAKHYIRRKRLCTPMIVPNVLSLTILVFWVGVARATVSHTVAPPLHCRSTSAVDSLHFAQCEYLHYSGHRVSIYTKPQDINFTTAASINCHGFAWRSDTVCSVYICFNTKFHAHSE